MNIDLPQSRFLWPKWLALLGSCALVDDKVLQKWFVLLLILHTQTP